VYEIFDHTADLGLRIRADDLAELFEESARALFSVIVVNFDQVRPLERLAFALEAQRRDELLRDWLGELLYVFHTRRMVFSQFAVNLSNSDARLRATAEGEPTDPARHEIDTEIKAITYHGLQVARHGDGWLAEVIVDV